MCSRGERAWRATGARVACFALLVISIFASIMPAMALTVDGPATFGLLTPAEGGVVTQLRPVISTEVFDPAEIRSTGYSLSIDGVAARPSFSYRILGWVGTTPILDKRYATIKLTPRADLSTGAHTVRVTVVNSQGVASSGSWSFTVTAAPVLSDPLPTPLSAQTVQLPEVSARVSLNAVGITPRMWIDGTEVPALFDTVSSRIVGYPDAPLAYESSHEVLVTATNVYGETGSLSWSFFVQLRPAMSAIMDCAACHPTMPAAHPMTNCAGCHGPGSPLDDAVLEGEPHDPGYLCPPEWSCAYCHNGTFTGPPFAHDFVADTYHQSADECFECHAHNLAVEHNHDGMTCLTCHGSTDPRVATAIATGLDACMGCHDRAGHEALHVVEIPEVCLGCHAGSLITIHGAYGCDGCHESPDPAVIAAIAAGSKECAACHGSADHVTLHEGDMGSGDVLVFSTHVGGPWYRTVQCSMCHATSQLLTIHGRDCDACHAGTVPRNSFPTWGGGCQQGTCHPVVDHPKADPAHNAIADENCVQPCHDPVYWDVSDSECYACHDPASGPPVTTSNLKASYLGPATIAFTAPGVTYTFSRLDGGIPVSGKSLVVPAPVSGSQAHTLEYWSVNDAGFEETPHKTGSFTVTAP